MRTIEIIEQGEWGVTVAVTVRDEHGGTDTRTGTGRTFAEAYSAAGGEDTPMSMTIARLDAREVGA